MINLMRTHHPLAGRSARRQDPIQYAIGRAASSMAVVAALVAVVLAAVVEAVGLPVEVSLLAATGVFVVLALAAANVATPGAAPVELTDRAAVSMQLGPDTEQVTSRRTGART
jgi:hypothetical protein